jgi:hypothetical protein
MATRTNRRCRAKYRQATGSLQPRSVKELEAGWHHENTLIAAYLPLLDHAYQFPAPRFGTIANKPATEPFLSHQSDNQTATCQRA